MTFQSPRVRGFVVCGALAAVMAMGVAPANGQGPGGPNGVDIQIRAENWSTDDTPFCGQGGGKVGDKLKVDAFMSMDGVVTGAAIFEDADGAVTIIPIDTMFSFLEGFGGMLVQDSTTEATVAIWMSSPWAGVGQLPALVNVESPRGCNNTLSTFTPGIDKVTMQIKFR